MKKELRGSKTGKYGSEITKKGLRLTTKVGVGLVGWVYRNHCCDCLSFRCMSPLISNWRSCHARHVFVVEWNCC